MRKLDATSTSLREGDEPVARVKVSKIHFRHDELVGLDSVELWVKQHFEVGVFE
jgi:hypothetical protein